MLRVVRRGVIALVGERAWRRLGALRNRFIVRTFREYEVRREFAGTTLTIAITDPLAKAWYRDGYESHMVPEMELLSRSKLQPGATAFDLGAHQGVHALMLAARVGPEGRVIAVEADGHNARVAERNRDLNRANNLKVIRVAIGEKSGTAWFTQNAANGSVVDEPDRAIHVEMPMRTIDDIANQYGLPDVLYVDIEGHECRALQGASKTLKACPDVFVEVHTGAGLEQAGGSVRQLLAHFPEHDYQIMVAPAVAHKRFVPINKVESGFFEHRFYLLALSRAVSRHSGGEPQ